ncbi:histidine kinase [Bordetella genomosp. 9]|uniref:biofilm regulation protein phosphatase SiaA n=1 Tax=Bordetella genomosp. 9 TaxID=1416803 RepID=UPI000A296E44|nr:biofilm regulation protein phosphatase SiaA [Bordetella genomosp. 9]ARP91940.1 histidine kinase [Bordetella genomosp. 9]
MAKLGLRAKSLLALGLACLLALIPTALLGWHAMEQVREHFGRAYADNFALLSRQRILAPVLRELALSQRFIGSELARDWLLDEKDPAKRERFFREAEGFRDAFRSHAYFLINAASGNYYFNEAGKPLSQSPRYKLRANDPEDRWFYDSLAAKGDYNINVNPDGKLKITRVWFNVIARDNGQPLAIGGASLDLSDFLHEFVGSGEPGVTPIIIDDKGNIQAHPDPALIDYNSGAAAESGRGRIFTVIQDDAGRQALDDALRLAPGTPDAAQSIWVRMQGKRQLMAVSYVPELRWYVLAAVDLHAARIGGTAGLWPAIAAVVLLIGGLLAAFGYAVNRLVLRPIRKLQQSARAIADGRYDVRLPAGGADEIGDLSRAFGVMAEKVRTHTQELEIKVRERTQALEAANRAMASANKKIGDSIDYASLIQQAILPRRQMAQSLGERHFVMWKPRDVVGGDFYVFRPHGENCLLGVMDCAGHGVPGALMTMLVRAALDVAIAETGPADPAAILARTDAAIRGMLADMQLPHALATNTDAGLVYIDRAAGRLAFAGAKISLYESDGAECREHRGARRSLGDKRRGEYANLMLPLAAGTTFYLSTDGFLDQAGGEHGFGFGSTRFVQMLKTVARLPLADQCEALDRALADYRGDLPQRDDITILSFRFE